MPFSKILCFCLEFVILWCIRYDSETVNANFIVSRVHFIVWCGLSKMSYNVERAHVAHLPSWPGVNHWTVPLQWLERNLMYLPFWVAIHCIEASRFGGWESTYPTFVRLECFSEVQRPREFPWCSCILLGSPPPFEMFQLGRRELCWKLTQAETSRNTRQASSFYNLLPLLTWDIDWKNCFNH